MNNALIKDCIDIKEYKRKINGSKRREEYQEEVEYACIKEDQIKKKKVFEYMYFSSKQIR